MADRRFWIALVGIACVASARVFVWSAAFPFFSPVDEHVHFDLVQKYSRGFLPGGDEASFDASSARLIVENMTSEYVLDPEGPTPDASRPIARRLATQDPDDTRSEAAVRGLAASINFDADAAPAYYLIAGPWLKLGRMLGIESRALLYWVRFLNAALTAAAVVVAGLALRAVASGDAFLALGSALVVGLWPNELFYSITPDMGSVLIGALAFYGLARIATGAASEWTYALAGFAVGVAFLTKYTNVFLLAAAVVALWLDLRRHGGSLRPLYGRWAAFAIQAALPAGWWLVRNAFVVGSVAGQHRKLEWLQWTPLAPAQMLDHPLVGLHGWPPFLDTLLRTFWTGEAAWHSHPGSHPLVDTLLVVTSAVFLLASVVWLARAPQASRQVAIVASSCCVAAVGVLAALSASFDFFVEQGAISRSNPYIAAGRLVAGAILPFAFLYCAGIHWLWSWAPARVAKAGRWTTLVTLLALVYVGEIAVTGSAFASPSNWYRIR